MKGQILIREGKMTSESTLTQAHLYSGKMLMLPISFANSDLICDHLQQDTYGRSKNNAYMRVCK